MERMRRIHKAFLSLALLILAGTLGVEVLNRVVLPVKARQWAEASASRALGREVSIGAVRLSVWRGFLLEKVSIAEDPRFGTVPFLEADQISGGVLFLPLLGKREILIPVLHLVHPRVRFLQDPEGNWNFRSLSMQWPAAGKAGAGFQVRVSKILLSDGICEIKTIRIESINADLHLSLPAQIQGDLTGEAPGMGRFALKGHYSFQEHRLLLESRSVWELPGLLPFLPEKGRQAVEHLEGSISLECRASGNPRDVLEIHGTAQTRGLEAGFFKMRESGDLSVEFQTRLSPLQLPKGLNPVKGTIVLKELAMGSVPYVGDLRGLSGELAFDAGGVRAERLTLQLSNGTPVELSGSVANDETRSFGFRATADFPAEQPPPLPKEWADFLKKIHLSGKVSAEAVGNGALLPAFSLRPTVTVRLEEAALQPPHAPRVEIDRGQIRWQPDLITFTGISGRMLNQPLSMEGTLARWDQPEINGSFSWGKLDGDAQISLSSEKISVNSLSGQFGKGTFRIFGEISRPETDANLYGEAAFRAEDLPEVWPAAGTWMKQHPIEGETNLRGLLQGPLFRPAEWDLDLHAGSPALRAQGIPLQALSLHLRQSERQWVLESASARLAGGNVAASGSLDGNKTSGPWKARVSFTDLQLDELAQALRWTTTTFSGGLRAEWSGAGEWGRAESIAGNGTLDVAGAQILELPLLGKFAEFLGLPTLRTIRFQEAQGPFRIKEGRVETDSLLLRSPQATLAIRGWGGFLNGAESPIQWKIFPTFAPELIPEESRSKIGKVIAKGASYFVGEVQLLGTWKEPKRKFVSKKVTQILNEQIFNLQDILGDLF